MANRTFNMEYPSKKLKFVVSINDEILTEVTDPNFEMNYIDIGNVNSVGEINEIVSYKFSNAPSRARRKVQKGDVIISTVRTYLRAIASIDTDDVKNLIVSTGFAVIRPKKNIFHSDFCKYALIESNFIDEVQKRSVGVSYPAINASDLGDISLPVPSYEAQVRISNYLNNEIGRIEKLIKAKEQLINILIEKSQALITQTVTKGLDQNVKLKDSGLQWLGKVPEHWEIKKMKYLAELRSGDFISAEDIKNEEDYPVYGGNGLRGFTGNYNQTGNFVLIGRQGALCGNINYASNQFWATEHAIVCSPKEEYDILWFGELLRIMNLNQYSIAAAQPGLSVDVIKNLFIPVPNLSEQKGISKQIKNFNQKTEELIIANQKSIHLLKERRTVLISAAVTGQIKIPEV